MLGKKSSNFILPFTQGYFVLRLVEISHVNLKEKIFDSSQRFLLICQNYLHLKKDVALLLNKFEFPSPNNALC